MTKSRTLRKAGAVVLSLAMAFSVAGVAPSADAAAKKPALSAKKGTITVGKTKAVKIQNTTKKKVKKLVVSSSNKKVATVKKNNKVKFTVTGKTAGTAKITAKVTLKKKVAKKKVFTLKYTATVKAAATPTEAPSATPGELKLDNVESAQRVTVGASDMTNVIVAYFSSAVSEFAASDVEIRRVSDNALFTAEKVVFTSDKKQATITLTGTSSAGTAGATTSFLESLVDYNLIVKTGTKTLEKKFIIPLVLDNVIVSAVDAKNKKITLGATAYTLGDGVTVDNYFELLGKTVTAEVDNTGKITKLTVIPLTEVIGAFTYSAGTATANATYKEAVSGTVYSTTGATTNTSTKATRTVQYDTKFVAGGIGINGAAGTVIPASDLVWGKLVLNPDGTIRTIQGIAATPNSAYVTANAEGVITNGASVKVNLKDYVIIKDGKTIEAKDIAVGDVFIYNAATSVGYIYNNPIKGVFSKDYGTKYVFADKEYSQAVTALKDGKEAALTTSAVGDLITAKTEITLYTNIAGLGVYAVGEAAALTSTINLFVTSAGWSGDGDSASASITGFNPATSAIEKYEWKGNTIVAKTVVNGWITALNDKNASASPVLVKMTVDANDAKVVKKVEAVAEAYNVATGPTFLEGKDTTVNPNDTVINEISKSTKLIGSTNANGMDPSKSKVVIYKNPATDTTAWKATNFTVTDFSSWTGKLVESGAATGVFTGTKIFGTLSKTVDFILAEGATAQKSAGAVGLEAGTPFVGFVTEKLDGASKRVKAITSEGEKTYETFYEDNKTASLAASVVGRFVIITPTKTFATDNTIFKIETLGSKYAEVSNADYAAYTSNGSSLVTYKAGTPATYKELDIASDVVVIKKSVKDGNTSYALSTATAISQYCPIAAYTAEGNTSIVKLVLFGDKDIAAGATDAISGKTALTFTANKDGSGDTLNVKNTERETEKAYVDALSIKADDVKKTPATTCKFTASDNTLTTTLTATSSAAGKATVTSDATAGVITATYAGEGDADITITYTGTYYTKVWIYTVTGAAATNLNNCVVKQAGKVSVKS